MSLIGALTKAAKAGEAAKKTAPFYSAVDEALANIARPKGTGAEFLTELSKQPGVKKAELADRKLEQAFKAKGKITKEEAQQILKENPPPKLQEREYNEKMVREEEDIKEELAQQMYGRSYDDLSHRERRPIFDETQRIMGEENGPQYGDYKTPGGQNYREILLKLPESRPNADKYRDPAKYDADLRAFNASGKADYQSSHWKQDPNVLAHMRVQDRTGPNGEKILHVEEIQSDWHQAGRKKGYIDETDIEKQKAYDDFVNGMKERLYQKALMNGYNEQQASITSKTTSPLQTAKLLNEENKFEELRFNLLDSKDKVPDAPFKKNWHELAMKRLLNYAADKGYDSIAITPGAEQAKRYDLSKQLSEVLFDPSTGHLAGRDHDGKLVVAKQGVTMENLPDYIGKEGAQKILETPADQTGVHALRGADLSVGGEGMKGFYDQILPSYLNTFGKPYGTQVGKIPVQTGTEMSRGASGSDMIPTHQPVYLDMHNFPITPEMRESIKQKGLPLYQQIGIPTAGAGAASQMPEPEEGLAGGGVVNSLAKTEALAKLAKLREQMAPRAEAVQNLMKMDENRYLRDVVPNSLTNAEIEAEIARMKARAEASQPEVKNPPKYAAGGSVSSPIDYSKSRFFNPADPFAAGRALNAAYQSTGLPAMDRYGGRYAYELSTEAGRKAFGDAVNRVSKNTGEYGIYKPTDLNELAGAEISNPNTKNIYANLFTNGNSYFIPDYLEADPYQYNYHLDQTASGRTREQQNADFDRMYGGQMIANNAASALGRVYENGMGDQESIMRDFLKKKEDPNYGLPTVNNVGQGRDAAMKELYNNYGSQLAAFDVGRGDLTYDQGSAISKALEYQKYLDNQNMVVNQRTQGLKNIQNELANLTVNNGNTDTYNQMKAALEGRIQSEQANLDFAKKAQAMYQSTLDPYLQTVGGIENRDKLSSVDVLNMLSPVKQMANGGAVNYNTAPDMSDGGRIMQGAPFKHGGKVKVTTNRDAMFMELSNKKLKRK